MLPVREASAKAPRVPVSPALVAGALSGVAFALGAAPSVTDRDAGELATAAFRLDVAHPSGFPLDMVLLRLAELVPCGDVAFRANLAVGALTAVACGLATRTAWSLADGIAPVGRWPIALLPTLVLVCSSTVLRAATAAEVYGSTLACASLALALVLGSLACGASRALAPVRRAASLLTGASLALHTSARPAPVIALAVLTVTAIPWRTGVVRSIATTLGRRLGAMVPLGLCGLAAVAYLPVAARRRGPIDWGDPRDLHGLWRHLTAAAIRATWAPRMLTPWRFPEDLARVGGNLLQDLGRPLILLAAIGAAMAVRAGVARVLVAVATADLFFAVAIHPMGTYDRQTLFVMELALGLLATYALAGISRLRLRRAPALAGALACALGLLAIARCDTTWAGAADGWSETELLGGPGALGAVPARAVVLCVSDDFCGGAFYAQWVEGERPDVTVLPRQDLADPPTWRRLNARRLGAPVPTPRGAGDLRQQRLRGLLATVGDRVRWENPEQDDARWLAVHPGSGETPVLATVDGPVTSIDLDAVAWVAPRLPTVRGAGARWVGALVVFGAARRAARVGLDRAVPLWVWTLGLEPRHAPSLTNLGVAAARSGRTAEAIALTRRAVALDPERSMAWRNLAEYLAAVGDPSGAATARAEARRRTE